ncbi:uncharacterized protein MYCGRDRAFT_85924 [Zymoseptoria tritici IPO323]|uniref:Kri1-like C-terminal domain-containing protein n=1 Tax=Zymoseptoria tritici (strain CBS 115943 / IPO323) TaxID=336722 RepID=F9XAH7_ZYMTI|nr:uncharacterized protein MYCGRDRAFT_85924 [Zymoseptoria tritici IPO323]EGP86994.1 hypothetical protein MYCGRDRAFT_85924 [Zymoseptoria tritici IPO323]
MSKAERATKRQKFLEEESDESDAGVPLLQVNEEYARRFEHNKKREELSRLEEKFKDNKRKRDDDSENDSSSGSDEDDVAELATADLDEEIFATLQAIKNKDPRVYDPEVKFYREFDAEAAENGAGAAVKSEKPMYLQDYHRQNYLAGKTGAEEDDEDEDDGPPAQTYQQEQDQLKRELVGHEDLPGITKKKEKKAKKLTDTDIREADKDPETFLSNFMAARAWLPSDGARFQPLESDDSDEDARADEYEEAYNLRFEDPAKANEKLASFSRDVGKYGVRREEKTGRAKARDRERELKEAMKREREEDKARLRKLKIEQAEEKVKRIKEAAGLRADDVLDLAEWKEVIDGDFDDDKWEEEMTRRFGEDYYAAGEGEEDSEGEAADKKKKRKAKKPKWDDDIDIGDLVPDFDPGDKPTVSLSDLEASDDDGEKGVALDGSDGSDAEEEETRKKPKSKKDRAKEKSEAKRAARKQRQQIESLVDSKLPITMATSSTQPTSAPTGFRYRETSPTTFGLTPRDILFASDAALNNFAGLKKLAAFRDEERKKKERKKLSKKGRVKMWRRETFGREEPPEGALEDAVVAEDEKGEEVDGVVDGEREGKKKKKRSKGGKGKATAALEV